MPPRGAVQAPVGSPVGFTQPMYQLSRMNRNSAIDSPTRSASARAMRLSRERVSLLLRSMNTPAPANEASTSTKAITITVFMGHDYPVRAAPCCVWQLDRARQKLDLQARIEARADLPPLSSTDLARDDVAAQDQHYRRIVLRGRWLAEHTVYLDNRQMNARQGFFVVTPLLLAGGDAVLVQRGWSPRDFSDRSRLVPVPTAAGEVQLDGRIAPPPSKLLVLAGAETGAIRQNLDLIEFSRETGLRLRPLSVQQLAPAGPGPANGPGDRPLSADSPADLVSDDGLLRQWLAPALDVSKHHGYAFQWFALCALIVGLTAWFQFIRPLRLARRP
jgi:surfeit locus 1 family protein